MPAEITRTLSDTSHIDSDFFLNHSGPIRYLLSSEQEFALIQRCIAGDSIARSQLLYSCRSMLYRLVYRFVGPVHDIDDLIQDIYVELFQSLKRFKGKSRFSTWMYRICANVCMTYLRKKTQHNRLFVPCDFGDNEISSACKETDGDEVIRKRRMQATIAAALLKLPPKKRLVLVLCDIEGRTMEEISEIVRRPLGTIKSRLFNARNELRSLLEHTIDRHV